MNASTPTRKYYAKAACLVLCLMLSCLSINAHAFGKTYGDDETILIEQANPKFSYSAAVKTFSKHVLKFDVDNFLSGGQNCRDAVIRSFSDLSERTKYRLNLKHDRVEAKFTLNF